MEWIELCENPPNIGERVLVCDEFNDFVTTGKLIEITEKDETIFEIIGNQEIDIDYTATHWMPLPLPVGENVNF